MIFDLLFYVFVIIVCIQLYFYIFIFSKFAFAKPKHPSQKNIGVSILVCAKDEAENLKTFIPTILSQDYPKYELILINDDSTDDSLSIMHSFEEIYDNVKVVNVASNDAFFGNKKYALTLGIKASSYNFLLFTDADCKPISNLWIKSMSSHFSNTKTIVIGYGGYKKIKHSFLNLLIRFETTLTAMQYFSYVKIKLPYMAVGRNLAYRKEEFFNVNGFTNHMQLRSGDDDLFINQVANHENTAICFTKNSFTESLPELSFKNWFNQKRRHLTTAKYYKPIHKTLLGIFYLSQLLFWSLSSILLVFQIHWKIVLVLILVRLSITYLSFGFSAKKLETLDTLILFPFLEIFLVFTQMVIFISNLTSKTHHWR